ncbi:MAG: hypothetical protein ASARMPRED_001389 [Alectoria sarmentosa]|nr:MAG: hypothetical protein ASARMPRED_001389 [Alectoria sarmentosa]
MKTLQDLLYTFAGNSSPAVIVPQKTPLKYNDLYNQVQYLQGELASLNLNSGSCLSIVLPNSFEFVALFLAISCMRAVAVPLNPALKQDEYGFYLEDLESEIVFVPKGAFCERHAAVLAALDKGVTIIECCLNDGQIVLDQPAAQQDVALILHTSGTTGRPKAVPLTHQNILASVTNVCATYNLTPHDRTVLIIPLFHIHGLLASTLAPLYSGGTVIIPNRLTPSFWTDFIAYNATWYTGTPTSHSIILQFPLPKPIPPRLRFIRSGSGPLSPSLHQKLETAFGVPVLDNYALTEACGQITSNLLPPVLRKPGSVGTATGVAVLILDPQGRPLPPDTEGEICIRGPNVTSGYLDNETANAASFTSDRFFRTGDYGRCDGDGYLFLTGRIKEVINKGGEKISPAELDDVIVQHPAVVEAATFAMEDEMYGQDVAVAVRIFDGEKIDAVGLRRWIRGRVAAFKVPKKIFFVSEIPKTATGKVRRDVLAKMVLGKEALMPKL